MAIKETSSRPTTFVQDSSTPINVTIEYDSGSVTFPVNPETLKQTISSQSVTETIEAMGEISIPQRPSLTEITFESFFWADLEDENKPKRYILWLKRWQKSRKPARLIVSRLDWFSMNVTCENLSYWVNAGEEKDIYFEITLKEYKQYQAQEVKLLHGNIASEATLEAILGNAETVETEVLAPVIMQKPSVTRTNINKPPIKTIIETKDDDSIVAITRRTVGDSSKWKTLYEDNKEAVSVIATSEFVGTQIPLGCSNAWKPTEVGTATLPLEKALKKTITMSNIFKKLNELSELLNEIESFVEDIEDCAKYIRDIRIELTDLYKMVNPEGCVDGVNSLKRLLKELSELADFPKEAVEKTEQMIEIVADLVVSITEFISEW